MKSILDPSFEYTPSYQTDIHQTFERVWRELGDREDSQADVDAEGDSLWLECNGELVGAGSVDILGVHVSAPGIEMVEFVCPHCNQRHESLTFR